MVDLAAEAVDGGLEGGQGRGSRLGYDRGEAKEQGVTELLGLHDQIRVKGVTSFF